MDGMVLELAKYPGAERVFSIGLMRCDAMSGYGIVRYDIAWHGTIILQFNS